MGCQSAPIADSVGRARVIGDGVADFRRFVQNTHFDHSRFVSPDQACLSFAASFFAKHLIDQTAGVASLRNRWGWGMEMLYQGAKYDRILFQAFAWEKSDDGTEPRFEQFGDKIFNYYSGDILTSLRQRADGHWVALKAGPLTDVVGLDTSNPQGAASSGLLNQNPMWKVLVGFRTVPGVGVATASASKPKI
jgi:hypothetical protein